FPSINCPMAGAFRRHMVLFAVSGERGPVVALVAQIGPKTRADNGLQRQRFVAVDTHKGAGDLKYFRRAGRFCLRGVSMVLMRKSGVEAPRMVKVLLVTRRP
ncbi:MAG: hypothetical protein ACOH2M_24895, partial [Cypionkella sp.]